MVRIPEVVRRLCRVTPLLFAPPLGCYLKLESLQRTGSFKLRGAALKLARLPVLDRVAGVVAASAGNHGLGVACAARALGVSARVVVPENASRIKREGISSFGAEVIRHGATYDEAEKLARRMTLTGDSIFVSPFDDTDVIEGNGAWLGREILEQRPQLRCLVIPVGGGGLAAGLASELAPDGVRVIGVQPHANCAMHESLKRGRALIEYHGGQTICDGLEGGVGWRTYRAVKQHVDHIELVEEDEIMRAVIYAFRTLGLVVEPSAAVVLAAALAGKVPVDANTALLITGGNVDSELLDRWLEERLEEPAPSAASSSGRGQ